MDEHQLTKLEFLEFFSESKRVVRCRTESEALRTLELFQNLGFSLGPIAQSALDRQRKDMDYPWPGTERAGGVFRISSYANNRTTQDFPYVWFSQLQDLLEEFDSVEFSGNLSELYFNL